LTLSTELAAGQPGFMPGVEARSPYFKALAIDFDGTLAEGGPPAASVLVAVRSARDMGLRFLLVTGRTLTDLWQVFPDVDEHFDLTVAENGAVLRAADGHRRNSVTPSPSGRSSTRSARSFRLLVSPASVAVGVWPIPSRSAGPR
jgi:trehalose-6-phosphatase